MEFLVVIFFVVLSAFIILTLYKAVYDIFLFNRRHLMRQLEDLGYTDIEVSKAEYEDIGNNFPEKSLSLLNIGSVPLCYVHYFKLRYKDSHGKAYRSIARVESRYFKKANILIKEIA